MNDADMMREQERKDQMIDALLRRFEPGSPAQTLEERIDRLIDELDEITVMVMDDETAEAVVGQKRLIGALFNRCGTLVRLIMARQPAGVRRAA